MKEMSGPTRRKFPRKSFKKAISYIHNGEGEVVEGVEIGEGGISFRTNVEIALEQKLVVNFFLPEGDFFSLVTTLKISKKIRTMLFTE